jgi:hypothetical protein
MDVIHIAPEVTTVCMQQLPMICWACGRDATGTRKGIPVYEDMILPNDWEGEWGGVPACELCFALQSSLAHPIPLNEFKQLNPQPTPRP